MRRRDLPAAFFVLSMAANQSHPTAPVLRRAWRDVPKQEKKEGFARTACRTQPIEQERSAPAAGRQGGRQKAAGGRRRCAQPIAREKSACATGRQGGRRKAAGGVGGARSTGIPPAEAKAWRQGRTGASGMNTTTRFAGGCHDGLPRLVRFPPLLTLRNPARLFPGCPKRMEGALARFRFDLSAAAKAAACRPGRGRSMGFPVSSAFRRSLHSAIRLPFCPAAQHRTSPPQPGGWGFGTLPP